MSLKTNMSKNDYLPNDKKFWPIFMVSKTSWNKNKGPKSISTITVENKRSFFSGRKKLLKTQIFEKKGIFPRKKKL